MNFEVETTYTEADFIAAASVNWMLKCAKQGMFRFINLVMRLFAVVFVALGVVSIIMFLVLEFYLPIVFVSAFFFLISWWMWDPNASVKRRIGKASWNAYKRKGRPLRFRFEEDSIEIVDGGNVSTYRYHALMGAVAKKEYYILYFSEEIFLILKKTDFTIGDPEVFCASLAEKLGQPLDTIK